MQIRWLNKSMQELDVQLLYQIFRLRQTVFVLEQNCLYPDIDALDEQAVHVLGLNKNEQLIAYLRILPPGLTYQEPAIGRVVVTQEARGLGIGRQLIDEGVKLSRSLFANSDIRISAQSHLSDLYIDAGFQSVGDVYLEDDIPHQEMLLTSETT